MDGQNIVRTDTRIRNSLNQYASTQQRQQSISDLRLKSLISDSSANQLRIVKEATTETAPEHPRMKDIRDATTVQEVREIMNQVKSKYRDVPNSNMARKNESRSTCAATRS